MIEIEPALVIRFDAFGDGKFRRQLDGSPLRLANAFKDEYREVVLHLFEVSPIPVAEFALLIEKRDRSPLAGGIHQLRALDGLRLIESAVEIGIAEPAEHPQGLLG